MINGGKRGEGRIYCLIRVGTSRMMLYVNVHYFL